jgi:2-polyprenyl-3-methyl-5-hydroxy-6-metoxy-1,4-benzoquinol methylase
MNCNICQNKATVKRFEIKMPHVVYSCQNCEAAFMEPQLDEASLAQLYSEQYYKAWGISGQSENEVTKQMKQATFELRLNTIQKFIGGGNILDVGCATGYFLEVAAKRNFEPFGVEFSDYSSAIAKTKFGNEKVFHGILEDCTFQNASFDVIAMSDLIEHVRIPSITLAKAAALLKDNGVIMIMTPNHNSLSRRLMGRRWTHYKLEHFFYFTQKAMQLLAEQCNLELVYYEKSKKALTIDYLFTQWHVYPHWLLTPLIKVMHSVLPKRICSRNFYFSIGEMVVILKKK